MAFVNNMFFDPQLHRISVRNNTITGNGFSYQLFPESRDNDNFMQGSFGEVIKAHDMLRNNNVCACKIIRAEFEYFDFYFVISDIEKILYRGNFI